MMHPKPSVLIVGAGWTGKQIAAQCAIAKYRTFITDASAETLASAVEGVFSYANEQVKLGIWNQEQIDALKRHLEVVSPDNSTQLSIGLLIESVSEQSSVKRKVLQKYSAAYPDTVIIASNSSYFLPSQLSRYVEQPHRFAHLHFHVPVAYATLVDIIGGPECKPEIVDQLEKFATSIGQTPLVQHVENPGYVFNWLLQSLLKSALELIDRNVATPDQIETAWKTVTKMPIGPIGIIDRIGVDVVLQVLRNASWNQTDDSMNRLMAILEPLVDQGKLGWKSGEGFFKYSPPNDHSS